MLLGYGEKKEPLLLDRKVMECVMMFFAGSRAKTVLF